MNEDKELIAKARELYEAHDLIPALADALEKAMQENEDFKQRYFELCQYSNRLNIERMKSELQSLREENEKLKDGHWYCDGLQKEAVTQIFDALEKVEAQSSRYKKALEEIVNYDCGCEDADDPWGDCAAINRLKIAQQALGEEKHG